MSDIPPFPARRHLGRTNFVATRMGIGDLADRSLPIEQCVATARRALDAGLNLIDTAPGYEDGYSEQIVGRALRESHARDATFLIDKIDHPDAPVAPQIDRSLKTLELENVDAFVFHGVSAVDVFKRLIAAGGGFDQLLQSGINRGKARFVGISSHHPDVLRMAIESGRCDLVMFPVGPYVDPRYVEEILPLAKFHNIGTVCFKTFGAGKLLSDTEGYQRPLSQRPRGKVSSGGSDTATPTLPRLSVQECLYYTFTLDPDVALLGMSFPNEQDAVFAAARDFRLPLTESQMHDIRRRAETAIQHKGPCWWNPAT